MCVKLSRVTHLLTQLRYHGPQPYIKTAYYAFFNSILLYDILLWGNGTGINKVLILQRKAVYILTGSS